MRWNLACMALVLAIAAAVGLSGALGSVGQPFPGFLVLGNRVVASAGLPGWPATRGGEIYQQEVVAIDGRTVEDVTEIHAHVRALPVGTSVHYLLRGPDGLSERAVPTRRFAWNDFALLHGAFLLNGLLLAGAGMMILRSGNSHGAGAAPLFLVAAFWGLSAMDLYGPHHLFRAHALSEAMLFAVTVHMALVFPRPLKFVRDDPAVVNLPYFAAAALAVCYQLGLYRPALYSTFHLLSVGAFGLALALLALSLILRARAARSHSAPLPTAIVAAGACLALAPAAVLSVAEPFNGGTSSQNVIAFTAFALPISVVWGVARRRPTPLSDQEPRAVA